MRDLEAFVNVTIPASSYDLVQLADVHTELSIPTADTSNDAWISLAITKVSTAIQNHCNRMFAAETLTETIYPQRDSYMGMVPGGLQPLQLSRWPIISVTSLTVLSPPNTPVTLTQGTDYILKGVRTQGDCGQLLRLNPNTGFVAVWEPLPITVVYAAGYASIPADLVDACLRLITKSWWSRARDPALMERQQGGAGTERFWISTGAEGNLTPDIVDMLDGQYRVPVAR